MTGFWARRLGLGGPAAPSAPAASGMNNFRPWWDSPVVQHPVQQEHPQEPVRIPKNLQSAKLTERCPDCNSQNYMAPVNSNARKRCYDCGYPLIQSGSYAGVPTDSSAPATPARQIFDPKVKSFFNPRNIIGKVG